MVRDKAISHSPKIREPAGWGAPLAAGAVVGALALALKRYGLELADEGVLLAHVDRVAHGQVPYRDFHVGYGPGLFYLQAALSDLFGASTGTVRTSLALAHALRAAALAGVAAALGGRRAAVVVTAVLIGFFLPVAPGLCAPGNIPYPSWFADVLSIGALLVLATGRGVGAAALAGALWATTFAFKQNTGVFGLGAGALTLALAAGDRTGGRLAGVLLAVGLVGGALSVLREHLDAILATVLVVPLLPLAIATLRTPTARRTATELAALLAGFVVVAGGVVAGMVALAGGEAVRTDFLQIGTDTAAVYFVPHPTPAWLRGQIAGIGWPSSARIAGDSAWFLVLPLVHATSALLVATGAVRSRLGIGVVTLAAIGYLGVYPRIDFWHLLPLAVPSLAAMALVLGRLPARIGRLAAIGLVAASAVRFAPTLPVLRDLLATPATTVEGWRLDVRFDLLTDERLTRLPEVLAAVRDDDRVAGFPALGIVNFALGRPSPWRHDYFFPGRPGPDEERALAAALAFHPPDAVVVLDAASGAFAPAFAAHREILEALAARMDEAARIGPYRILRPRGPG